MFHELFDNRMEFWLNFEWHFCYLNTICKSINELNTALHIYKIHQIVDAMNSLNLSFALGFSEPDERIYKNIINFRQIRILVVEIPN